MTNELILNTKSITKNITIKVKLKGWKKFKIRSFIGCQIMKIAAFVIGCEIEIKLEQNEK
jgi:hypothetical protein